jgi:hypothetical protein
MVYSTSHLPASTSSRHFPLILILTIQSAFQNQIFCAAFPSLQMAPLILFATIALSDKLMPNNLQNRAAVSISKLIDAMVAKVKGLSIKLAAINAAKPGLAGHKNPDEIGSNAVMKILHKFFKQCGALRQKIYGLKKSICVCGAVLFAVPRSLLLCL